jgi:SAM-dependent methyltransferase
MKCRICDSSRLDLAIDLGNHPWCNHFLKESEVGLEPKYPLRVVFCHDCGTSQLDYTVKKEVMFGDHTYLSGVTKSLSEHFKRIACEIDDRFYKSKEAKSVLDIGSNDGTQLKHFKDLGYEVLGVESSKTTAKLAETAGIPTLNEFFNEECAAKINRKFDVINASGVFFHLEELHSVTDAIQKSLAPNGVFLIQFLYMKRIVENLAFDQIYHEHLLYYNLRPLQTLLERHGLEIFDAYLAPVHGGSMMAFVTHKNADQKKSARLLDLISKEDTTGANTFKNYVEFDKRIRGFKRENVEFLNNAKDEGKQVWGFGAPVKGNTLLNYFEINSDLIQFLVERNELRRGLFAPGSHIPIKIESELKHHPDIYYVLAWNFKDEILARNQSLIEAGVHFHFPINPQSI